MVQALVKAREAATGSRPEPIGVTYGTDASALVPAGISCVVFGPGSIDQAHSDEEWVGIEETAQAAEILAQTALKPGNRLTDLPGGRVRCHRSAGNNRNGRPDSPGHGPEMPVIEREYLIGPVTLRQYNQGGIRQSDTEVPVTSDQFPGTLDVQTAERRQ